MRCSDCGKDIPFTGKVCPWCHTDESGDQQKQVTGDFKLVN
jgi:predicted amidophosphoribosyltransferase